MACLLCIETSGATCSAAVWRDGKALFSRADRTSGHADSLGAFVDEALSYVEGHRLSLDGVAVSGGPGSYTGLRIGVSMAKGICYGKDISLVAVPTLALMAAEAVEQLPQSATHALLCPMIDARRMEVYAAVYDTQLNQIRDVHNDIVDDTTYRSLLDDGQVYFFGSGAAKCATVICHPNAVFLNNIEPLAEHMGPLADRLLAAGKTVDVAYYTPFYLKPYIAGKPKKALG